jgi:hypothetical protein
VIDVYLNGSEGGVDVSERSRCGVRFDISLSVGVLTGADVWCRETSYSEGNGCGW